MNSTGVKMLPGFQLTLKSKNRKTGRIAVSTSPQWTCPTNCPYNNLNGCYAAYGPLKIVWDAVTKGSAKDPEKAYTVFLDKVAALPVGQLWRHNQAGDFIPDPKRPNRINRKAIIRLCCANYGLKGFTYTHFPVLKEPGMSAKDAVCNRECIELANVIGMTVNVSANSLAHVDSIMDSEIAAPVTVTLPFSFDGKKSLKTVKGRKVIMCPALVKDDMTCLKCGLCANPERKTVIAFLAHGCGKSHCQSVFDKWEKMFKG